MQCTLGCPYVVKIIDFGEGLKVKASGVNTKVYFVVVELVTGGELYDYISLGGTLNEEFCRYYFKQLLTGVKFIHQRGVAHRDLKPENILLDHFYNIKIADFGLGAPIEGRDGSGLLHTPIGTKLYMAPEQLLGLPYNGEVVDLFACGVVLFVMAVANPPFRAAYSEDSFYRYIVQKRADLFWKFILAKKPKGVGFISDELKDLLTRMLQYDPIDRLTVEEIEGHPWMLNGDLPDFSDIMATMDARKHKIVETKEAKRILRKH